MRSLIDRVQSNLGMWETTLLLGVAGILGASAALLLQFIPGRLGAAAIAGLVLVVIMAIWPQFVLPTTIFGGPIVAVLIGDGTVANVVVIHLAILGAGLAGCLLRWLFQPQAMPRAHLRCDVPMLLLTAAVVLGGLLGILLGNNSDDVVVMAYQLAVVPLYYFTATWTLTTPKRIVSSGTMFLALGATLTAIQLFLPGRHGGLMSALLLPPVVFLAGRATGWIRLWWTGLAAIFAADVALSAFRGIWLAAAVTLVILVVWGGARIRRGLVGTAALFSGAATLLIGLAAVAPRWESVSDYATDSAGYRETESLIGLSVFSDSPLLGGGFGQSVHDMYVQGMGIISVGPVYHSLYVTLLANAGIVGLGLLLWAVLRAIPTGFRQRNGIAFTLAAMIPGFLAFAMFAAPTNGHWELGLLPAAVLLAAAHFPASRPHIGVSIAGDRQPSALTSAGRA